MEIFKESEKKTAILNSHSDDEVETYEQIEYVDDETDLFMDEERLEQTIEIKCSICNAIFIDRESLKTHETLHLEHKCEFCNKSFYKASYLKKHQSNAHKTSLNVSCVICGNTFRSNYNLKQHLLTHSQIRQYPCSYENCLQTFRQISALQTHEKIHRNENRKQCPDCGLFVTKLKTHLLTHSTVRPFKCTFKKCESSFTTYQQLQAHQEGKHKSLYADGDKKGSMHKCDQCEAKFSFKSSLYKHKSSIHSKDKKSFECLVCKKLFNRKDNLFNHSRNVHSNIIRSVNELKKIGA